jgi:hypothetical protein
VRKLRLLARRVHQTEAGERITFICGDASGFGFVANVTATDLVQLLSKKGWLSYKALDGAKVAAELEVHGGDRCSAE